MHCDSIQNLELYGKNENRDGKLCIVKVLKRFGTTEKNENKIVNGAFWGI